MELNGWTALGLVAGAVAALAALLLNRKTTPKWISFPLLVGAAIIAAIGAYQSVLQFDSKEAPASSLPYDVSVLNPEIGNAVKKARESERRANEQAKAAELSDEQAGRAVYKITPKGVIYPDESKNVYPTVEGLVRGTLSEQFSYAGEGKKVFFDSCPECDRVTAEGYGVASYKSDQGKFYFSGFWVEGNLISGVASNPSGSNYKCTYKGQFSNRSRFMAEGSGVLVDFYGIKYSGDLTDGRRNGFGVQQFPNGARYEGGFENGSRNGYGVFWSGTGKPLGVGIWESDKLPANFIGSTFNYIDATKVKGEKSEPVSVPTAGLHELDFCTF